MSMTEFCCNCAEECNGSLRIEAFKGKYYFFCTRCFDLFMDLDIVVIREVLKDCDNFITF